MVRTVDDFKASHDPKTIITRLESELEEARRGLGMQAALNAALQIVGIPDREPSPAWLAKPHTDNASPGMPVLFLSDFHWGEVVDSAQIGGVNRYNLRIAQERLRHTVETAIRLVGIIDPKMRYPGIAVPLGGDMISGEIHDELKATNELPTLPTVEDLCDNLEGAFGLLADTFDSVYVPCVTGNHGRNTHKIWAKDRSRTSFDWMLYRMLKRSFRSDKRIVFDIADGPDLLFKVQGRRYLLTHGDMLGKGGDGLIGFLGPVTRGNHRRRTRQSQIDQPYDSMICGHWHSYNHSQDQIVNGSLKGYDEYAFTESFKFEPPQQALWIVHPKIGESFRMPVLCNG